LNYALWRIVVKSFNTNLVKKHTLESNIECIKYVTIMSVNSNCFAAKFEIK